MSRQNLQPPRGIVKPAIIGAAAALSVALAAFGAIGRLRLRLTRRGALRASEGPLGASGPRTVPKVIGGLVAVAVLTVGFLFAPASAASIPPGWSWVGPPNPSQRVAVVGDSLVWQAEHGSSSTSDPGYQRHALTDALNAQGMAARIAARSGATTDALWQWPWFRSPTVIVMALGTNDLYFRVPARTAQANVRTFLARWGNACHVYIAVKPSTPRGINPGAWNNWLRAEAPRTGGVYVDWPAISAAHPEWFVADQLHQTAAGQAGYRTAITEGVKQCP